jgi:hypothetical protein
VTRLTTLHFATQNKDRIMHNKRSQVNCFQGYGTRNIAALPEISTCLCPAFGIRGAITLYSLEVNIPLNNIAACVRPETKSYQNVFTSNCIQAHIEGEKIRGLASFINCTGYQSLQCSRLNALNVQESNSYAPFKTHFNTNGHT